MRFSRLGSEEHEHDPGLVRCSLGHHGWLSKPGGQWNRQHSGVHISQVLRSDSIDERKVKVGGQKRLLFEKKAA
jgi:hypothetical protein